MQGRVLVFIEDFSFVLLYESMCKWMYIKVINHFKKTFLLTDSLLHVDGVHSGSGFGQIFQGIDPGRGKNR